MVKNVIILAVLGTFGFLFYFLIAGTGTLEALPEVSRIYAETAAGELGAQNLVTAVITVYRGLDTLGEVAVLFIVSAAIGFLTRREGVREIPDRKVSDILAVASSFLVPTIILFGVYIFIHGHLTPGGGFQGGVVMAYAVIILLLVKVSRDINHGFLHVLESFAGLFYVLTAAAGLVLGGGFLDSRILPGGHFGTILSAGTIPVVYSLIGLKVGTELVGIIDNMRKG